MATPGRIHQRRPPFPVLGVDISPPMQQGLYGRGMAVPHCIHQRRPASLILHIDLSAPIEQKLEEGVKATGLSIDRVKEIYGEVIGDPDPWGRPEDYVDEHR